MLKRKIFQRTSFLLLTLIGVVTAVLIFFSLRENRIETKRIHLAVASVVTGEIERLILWDDRVAVRETLARQMEIHHLIEYAFIVLDGQPYVDSFGGSVPVGLLNAASPEQQGAYYLEFLDPDGEVYYDLALSMPQTGAVLRLGLKRANIDKQIYPAVSMIAFVGSIALLIGIAFSYRIALRATREITLLCDAIHSYRGQGDEAPSGLTDATTEVAELTKSFRGLVTERQHAEEELRQLRNYLSNIIDSMPSVLIGVDPDGKVTQWNSEARRTTGISTEAALGQPLGQVFPRLASDSPRMRQAMQTRQQQSDSKRPYPQEGITRFEDVTIYPLIANGVVGVVIRVDDVTERVRLEEVMIQSEKMLSVGGLAAGMAHEINNPLAGMMQTANVVANRLSKDLPANDRAAAAVGTTMAAIHGFMESRGICKMIDQIHASGIRAAEIVDNMLSFARKSSAAVSSHNLGELLDRSVDLASSDYDLKKQYDFRQIKIVREYQDDLPLVPCEGSSIQQVMLNILRNGAEAMRDVVASADGREPCLRLRTAYDPQRNSVRVEIEDNGPGMDEKTCKRVFEPFFTTKPVGVGTGLGLSISYFIVTENHGGEMSVESWLGAGTKFVIDLPVAGISA